MIQPATLKFLKELRRNNYRDWFQANRPRYEAAKANALEVTAQLIEGINGFDPSLGYAEPKRCMFRINRDTRFSADKSPYKDHIGIAMNPDGTTRSLQASYYVHIAPGEAFLSCGLYMLPGPLIKAVRTEIVEQWERFSSIVGESGLKREFGDLSREEKVLTRVPRGFDPESPAAEYLKLVNFYVFKNLPDSVLTSPDFVPRALELFELTTPLSRFLNEIVCDWEGR